VLRTIAAEGLLDHVKRVGEQLRRGIEALGHPLVGGVRGAGLLLGVVLTAPVAGEVATGLRDPRSRSEAASAEERDRGQTGFLVNACKPDVLRLAPPLILTADQADAFLAALPAALSAAASERAGAAASGLSGPADEVGVSGARGKTSHGAPRERASREAQS
jgi:acetylornithine aminotransferase